MKSLALLHAELIKYFGEQCATDTIRDVKTVSERFEHEGDSFFTITLPDFGKSFVRCLDQGRIDPSLFPGWKAKKGEKAPQFLRGLLGLVFDLKDGRLLPHPSVNAVYAIRQITSTFGKMELPCTAERQRKAIDQYVATDLDVSSQTDRLRFEAYGTESAHASTAWSDLGKGTFQPPFRDWSREQTLKAYTTPSTPRSGSVISAYRRIADLLWRDLFHSLDDLLLREQVVPRHSNGATADGLRGNAKYNQMQWTERLEAHFPHWEMLISSESLLDRTDSVNILPPEQELPVKVVLVPKTLKTPRIIAEEPTCMQYVQQGLLKALKQLFRTNDNARNFVNFDSQEPNQLLAREGSLSGELATLDLSEASDRVSIMHVEELLARHTLTREAVFAARSSKARVPGHGVISLAKFASMGSSLTFPIEAVVFMTAVFVGIERAINRPLTVKDVKSMYGKVRTYGDDIIVPVGMVESVVQALQDLGFVVNHKKSFWTGRYRESCGTEWYEGHDVSIVRFGTYLPNTQLDAEEVLSTVATRNQFYKAGCWVAAGYLDRWLEQIMPFPMVEETSPLLGRIGVFPETEFRTHPDYQSPLVKGMVVVAESPASQLDDYGALLKFFLNKDGSNDPSEDEKHLQRAGRPRIVRIKPRWRSPV